MKLKTLGCALRKDAGIPETDALALINQYTLAALTADQVYTRTAYVAHNAIDRDGEIFDEALLLDFARTLPGKGLFVKHPMSRDGDSGPGVGRWYTARVVDMSLDEARAALRQPALRFAPGTERAKLVEAGFYIPRSEKNANLIADVDAGVVADVSIGACYRNTVQMNDPSGAPIARRLMAPGEALETSFVWLGAQPGARVHKNFNTGSADMTIEQLQQRVKELETELAAAIADKAGAQALVKAAGDLSGDPAKVAQLIADGKSYRAALIEELVQAKRLKGALGDDATEVRQATDFYAAMPLAMLKAERNAWRKGLDDTAGIGGGDPNAGGGDAGTRHKAASQHNPITNALRVK